MIKKKRILFVIITAASMLFSSCNYYTPVSLIKAPVIVNTAYTRSTDLNVIVQEFLPKGGKLLTPNRVAGGKTVFSMDLDSDKSNEIAAFFRVDDEFQNGIVILKNEGGKWVKIFQKKLQSSSISKVDFINLGGKDKQSLLVGYYVSGLAGSEYDVYSFDNGKFNETCLGNAQKFEVLNNQKDNGLVFAAWNQDWGDVQAVNIYKFDGKIVTEAKDFYEAYLPKIMDYYNGALQKYHKDNLLIWYRIVETEVKGNDAEGALNSISKVENFKQENPQIANYNMDFMFLKAEALIKMKQYDEGGKILDEVIFKAENDSKINNSSNNIYLYDLYLEKGKLYALLNNNDKARDMFNKALGSYEDYHKNADAKKNPFYNVKVEEIKEQIKSLQK